MPTVTLLVKAYSNTQLKIIEDFLHSALKGMNVSTKICGITNRGWVQIAVSGEDEKAVSHYLAEEIGTCVTRLESVERFSRVKGYVESVNKSEGKLYVDIGVSSPKVVDSVVPLAYLQAQLADGKNISIEEIMNTFGLDKGFPLTLKISNVDKENSCIEAFLSESQLKQFKHWTYSMLDRLIILGVSEKEVKLILEKTGCSRDIIDVEHLGLFEHAVVCKLGTDAKGLIPKIGRNLQDAVLTVFNSEKAVKLLNPSDLLFSRD